MGMVHSRSNFRSRPMAADLVRASLLYFSLQQFQRHLWRARRRDGSDVVALLDRSGDPGRRRDQFSMEEEMTGRTDLATLVEARNTEQRGRSREGIGLLNCLLLELLTLGRLIIRAVRREDRDGQRRTR